MHENMRELFPWEEGGRGGRELVLRRKQQSADKLMSEARMNVIPRITISINPTSEYHFSRTLIGQRKVNNPYSHFSIHAGRGVGRFVRAFLNLFR